MPKTALVTGGTRGIGRGVTEILLRQGWHVVATGATQAEVGSAGKSDGLTNLVLDVTDATAVARLVETFSGLDGLVNCAGINRQTDEFDLEVFEQVVAVNLTGTMRMCIACHPHLKKNSGAIVNTASMLSIFGSRMVPAYSASKGGVSQLTKSLAAAWADDGVRVNAVAPGWIETVMTQPLRDAGRDGAILARTPQARWGTPEDVAKIVAMLLSDTAGFVTGTIIPVDGGYSAV
jgi:NAD(P)-dependent dehydrogenase (short-subunit alcohol dehydrogenase family)